MSRNQFKVTLLSFCSAFQDLGPATTGSILNTIDEKTKVRKAHSSKIKMPVQRELSNISHGSYREGGVQ